MPGHDEIINDLLRGPARARGRRHDAPATPLEKGGLHEGGWLHVEVATDDERAPEDLQHGGYLVQNALVRAREPLGRAQVNRDQHHAPRAEARVMNEGRAPDVDDRATDTLELPHA
eukprot:5830199-Pyramimonas_sp.AAC.1